MAETKAKAPVETDAQAPAKTEELAVETKPKAKKAKKKAKRTVASGLVHIQATFNNTMITVTDISGNTLAGSSAGASGFRGSKKGTAYAAQVASEQALERAKNDFGLSKVDVLVNGVGLGREAAIRAIQTIGLVVESITDVTPIAHGGVRAKNPRRG